SPFFLYPYLRRPSLPSLFCFPLNFSGTLLSTSSSHPKQRKQTLPHLIMTSPPLHLFVAADLNRDRRRSESRSPPLRLTSRCSMPSLSCLIRRHPRVRDHRSKAVVPASVGAPAAAGPSLAAVVRFR
ncbi:hypothetical protein LINPERPRIM_LOCUS6608, partial [Linum perenne]